MRGRRGVVVLVVALVGGCSGGGDDDGRAEPKAGEQVVVAEFDEDFFPRGVAVDGAGTVYTSGWDGEQFVIAAFPEEGKPTRRPIPCATAEGADEIGGSVAAAPDGTLYWSMDTQFRVVRLDPDGGGDCYAGTGERGSSGDGGPALDAQVLLPEALAYDADDDSLYISEGSQGIRRVDAAGVITTAVAAEGLTGQGRGREVALDQRRGRLYTTEKPGIVYRDRQGAITVVPDTARESLPFGGLAADPTGGDLVAARTSRPNVRYCDVIRIGDAGKVSKVPGSDLPPECADQLAVDARGDIWVVTDYQLIVIRPPR